MAEKPNAVQTLGIETSGQTLRAVQLSQKKGLPSFEQFFQIPLENSTLTPDYVKQLYTENGGAGLKAALEEDLIVTLLPINEVLVRPLEVKVTKEKDIDEVLPFQAEPL